MLCRSENVRLLMHHINTCINKVHVAHIHCIRVRSNTAISYFLLSRNCTEFQTAVTYICSNKARLIKIVASQRRLTL